MLKEKFLQLIGRHSSNTSSNEVCWTEIFEHYSSKSRYYHNLGHLENMLRELEPVKHLVEDLDSMQFSIFYHDVIYNSLKSDNEYQSALFFKERISKTEFKRIDYCFMQIEATKEHKNSTDDDTNILLDLDLSILGQENSVYKKYSLDVRKEYSIYPKFLYNRGRKKVLIQMLNSPSLFKTDYFISKYEQRARNNIKGELDFLS